MKKTWKVVIVLITVLSLTLVGCKKKKDENKTYQINYVDVANVEGLPTSYEYGVETALPELTKDGYTFSGWETTTGNLITAIPNTYQENITLKPKFEIVSYDITYQLDGGTLGEDAKLSFTVEDEFTLPIPRKTGYTFKGWLKANTSETITNIKETIGDLNLLATWELSRYTITYHLDGGTLSGDVKSSFTIEDEFDLPQITRKYCTFVNWVDGNGQEVSRITQGTTTNLEVYAVWDKITYQIFYELAYNENVYDAPTEYAPADGLRLPQAFKVGSRFNGWVLPNNQFIYNIPVGMEGDIYLIPDFTLETYYINYRLDGGDWGYHQLTTIDEVSDELFRDFYTFLGLSEATVTFELFKHDASGDYQKGRWYTSYKGKLNNNDSEVSFALDSYTFVNHQMYYDKWINFFNKLDEIITSKNPDESYWQTKNIGWNRLCDFLNQTYFTPEEQLALIQEVLVQDVPVRTYQYDEANYPIALLNPVCGTRTFLGWYYDSGFTESADAFSTNHQGSINLFAKFSEAVYPEEIKIREDFNGYIPFGENYDLGFIYSPNNVNVVNLKMESSDENVALIYKGILKPVALGQTTISVWSVDHPDNYVEYVVHVVEISEDDNPTLFFEYNAIQTVILKTTDILDLSSGVGAYDRTDGNLTENIIIDDGGFDPTVLGEYTITYSVINSKNNTATLTRKVIVNEVVYVGHRGSKLAGVENTEEAFIEAAKAGFTSLETDIKVTKDGVLVCWHDDNFTATRYTVADEYRNYTIAGKTWDELKNIEITQTILDPIDRNKVIGTYTSTLCTFDKYLEICRDYNLIPVIEIKSGTGMTNSDFSNSGKLVTAIKNYGLWDTAIVMTSQRNFLQHMRDTYDGVILQWLCSSNVLTYLDWCIENNIHIDVSHDYCTESLVKKCHDNGLFVNIYTIYARYQTKRNFQKFLDWGVDMITSDDVLSINDIPS